jgi:hypothetical protein
MMFVSAVDVLLKARPDRAPATLRGPDLYKAILGNKLYGLQVRRFTNRYPGYRKQID